MEFGVLRAPLQPVTLPHRFLGRGLAARPRAAWVGGTELLNPKSGASPEPRVGFCFKLSAASFPSSPCCSGSAELAEFSLPPTTALGFGRNPDDSGVGRTPLIVARSCRGAPCSSARRGGHLCAVCEGQGALPSLFFCLFPAFSASSPAFQAMAVTH